MNPEAPTSHPAASSTAPRPVTASVAQVAMPLPIETTFTYAIPADMEADAQPGTRVIVPFGNRVLTGLIVETLPARELDKKTRFLQDVLDTTPAFTSEMLALTKWIASYYLCGWGEVIRAALPTGTNQEQIYQISPNQQQPVSAPEKPTLRTLLDLIKAQGHTTQKALKKVDPRASLSNLRALDAAGYITLEAILDKPRVNIKKAKYLTLSDTCNTLEQLAQAKATIRGVKQLAVLDALFAHYEDGDAMPAQATILSKTGAAASTLKGLVKKGFITIVEKEVIRTPLGEVAANDAPPPKYKLHIAQEQALESIYAAITKERFETFLLHGVTGSGKTEVYIAALKAVLAKGQTGIVLVPEIALTPQTVARFRSHFGDQIAVLHSRMSLGERYDAWRNLRNGRYNVVIGPRSAILAPLSNIGLIVVDEEHETSYKQFDPAPRYHARDVAVVRASMNNAVCILGSATPSLESYVNAYIGDKYTYLSMPDRVPVPGHEAAPLPTVRTINLTLEKRKHKLPGTLSQALRVAIADRLEKQEQVILLQNRRGYSSLVECKSCGWSPSCDDCAVTLTYHKVHHHLRCHYCGQTQRLPRKCPDCGGTEITRLGAGTQRIEEELETQFPQARLLRMDLDTTTGKNAHFKILDKFARGEADILIGTQMVAKGLDFGRVTLVGVVNADVGMLMPDFRAEERSFQLLTQVAGRAGRSKLRGEVILQTRNPEHAVLQFAAKHDYTNFARIALGERHVLGYPPYGRVVRVEFRGPHERTTESLALKWHRGLTAPKGIQVLGPQPAFISRIQKSYRFHIILKAPRTIKMEAIGQAIKEATKRAGSMPQNYRIAVDVDAVSLF
ncbi:MAG: primosomal protein N' [Bacteroidota bacterium]